MGISVLIIRYAFTTFISIIFRKCYWILPSFCDDTDFYRVYMIRYIQDINWVRRNISYVNRFRLILVRRQIIAFKHTFY